MSNASFDSIGGTASNLPILKHSGFHYGAAALSVPVRTA
jgi:hypothetical protein